MIEVHYNTSLSENLKLTPEGYLLCLNVPLARTGEMRYSKLDFPDLESNEFGYIYMEHDETLFAEEFVKSINSKPVVVKHKKVTVENWRQMAKGHVFNARREGHSLVGDILVTDLELIKAINEGMREVSLGYNADVTQVSFARYLQVPCVCNHVAVINRGRAGRMYAIKDEETIKEDEMPEFKEEADVKVPASFFERLFKGNKDIADEETVKSLAARFDVLDKAHKEIIAKEDEIMSMIKALGDRQVGKKDVKDADPEEKKTDDDKLKDDKKEKKDIGDEDTTAIIGAINAFIPGFNDISQASIMAKGALSIALNQENIGRILKPVMRCDIGDMDTTETIAMLKSAFAIKQSQNTAKWSRPMETKTDSPKADFTPDELNAMYREYYKQGVK